MKMNFTYYFALCLFLLPLIQTCKNANSLANSISGNIENQINGENIEINIAVDTSVIDSVNKNSDIIPVENPTSADTVYFIQRDSILITLEARFSSGRLWIVEEQDSTLTLIDQWEARGENKGQVVDYQTFHFSSPKEGVFPVLFTRKRPYLQIDSNAVYKKMYIVVDAERPPNNG